MYFPKAPSLLDVVILVQNGEDQMDGGYPSFISPGCESSHLGLRGSVFFLKGSRLGERQFMACTVTIDPGGRPVKPACLPKRGGDGARENQPVRTPPDRW